MTIRSLVASAALLAAGLAGGVPVHAVEAATSTTQREVARISYPGPGVVVARLSGDERRLTGTPPSFKRFVRARLDRLYAQAGHRARCATSPSVIVKRYHGAGWATGGEGWYAPCPGGGYAVIYQRAGGGWRSVLPSQEIRFCQDLAWYGVPRFIAGRTCMTEDFDAVGYRAHHRRVTSPAASARRAVYAAGGNRIIPQRHVSLPPARSQLSALVDAGAHLTVDRCIRAGSSDPAAALLGAASDGCVVVASYRRGPDSAHLLRMVTAGDDVLVSEVVPVD